MRIVLVLAVVVVAIGTMGCARPEESPAELRAEVVAREIPIRAEIAALGPDHPWAGEYHESDMFTGTTVLIAPTSGCLVFDHGCLGIYGADWGRVSARDGRVHVSFERRGRVAPSRAFTQDYMIEGTGSGRCLKEVRDDGFETWLCLTSEMGLKKSDEAARRRMAQEPR